MKKFFALFLVLAILVPLGMVPVANAEEVTVQPFYILGWSDFDEVKFPYMNGLVTSTFSTSGANATISFGGAKIVYNQDGLDDTKVTAFAENLKQRMDARPQGARYWHLWAPAKVLKLKPENYIYLDYGVNMMKTLVTAIMKKYKEIGGLLDGIVIDTEYQGLGSYDISNTAAKEPLLYKQIVDDPRYATEVRPLLEERGFQFWPEVSDYTPEIYSADQKSGTKYALSRNIWNTVMRNRLSTYLNEWAYEPLKTYFPEASMSDYQTIDSKPWLKLAAVNDSGDILTGGNSFKAGTTSSYSFYMANPGESFYKGFNKYASFNDTLYEASPFNSLLFDMNFAKHMYLSNEQRQIAPWITHYDYKRFADVDRSWSVINSAYYSEQILHLGLLDPEPFLAYMYKPSIKDENGEATEEVYADRCNVVNELMTELTRVAGFSDRKPIEMGPYWNSEFILSGMYANGRNVWRITPNIDEVSLADFKVEGTDPTFYVKGQTVTFPGGKIIEDSPITHVGTCGYWIETSKDVTPIITREDNYFANYPSLIYDFEDVAEGVYDYNNHTPKGVWEFTWKNGATTTIEKVGDNKVLSLNGNAEVRSAKLPGNVTAGDTYAEDQTWAITVTIPEGLADDAEIILLNYVGTKQKPKDGGFKIAGGKVYYSTVGTDENGKAIQEYKELCAIKPGTYVFKREMDMNDPAAFLCTYKVFDTEGKEVASAKKVAVPVYTAITTIAFSTKNTGDKPVHLDDYKIYLTGLTTDFEIYDAAIGNQIPEENKNDLQDRSTAYRLSWLNATAREETATVMAAIYNGETLVEEKVIKEIKMAPGYDGVETGTVELGEGQTMKVYLKTTKGSSSDTAKSGPSLVVITAIACAAIILVAVIVILIPTKKKPAPAETTPEEKAE